jgi:hypothetical protein
MKRWIANGVPTTVIVRRTTIPSSVAMPLVSAAEAHSFPLFLSFLPEVADALEAAGTFARNRISPAHHGRESREAN